MKGDTRCVEGRLMRHDPQHDDPDLETDIGECPECEGDGCSPAYEVTVWNVTNGDIEKKLWRATETDLREVEEQYGGSPRHEIQIEEVP